jgi:hypothetical protein
LSIPDAPFAQVLLQDHRETIEKKYAISTSLPKGGPYKPEDLYKWADEVIAALVAKGIPNPKLELAIDLRVPSDHARFGALPTRVASRPRHRVLARLAKERLVLQFWTVNWDCHIENAFELAGLKRATDSTAEPWRQHYFVKVIPSDKPCTPDDKTVDIHKPHGCARAIFVASRSSDSDVREGQSNQFLIGKDELEKTVPAAPGQICNYSSLVDAITEDQFVVIGWAVSEEYLQKFIEDSCKGEKARQSLPDDSLSQVDIAWNGNGHECLARTFQTTKDRAFIEIEKRSDGRPQDDLFLWINALYSLDQLILKADAADKPDLEELRTKLETNKGADQCVLDWFDHFLPAWVRTCWRNRLVPCTVGDVQLDVTTFDMKCLEYFVPHTRVQSSLDLKVAARILAWQIREGRLEMYDYAKCPGAFVQRNNMIVPMPASNMLEANWLYGGKSLYDTWVDNIGGIKTVSVLLAPFPLDSLINDAAKERSKKQLARNAGRLHLADPSKIDVEVIGA